MYHNSVGAFVWVNDNISDITINQAVWFIIQNENVKIPNGDQLTGGDNEPKSILLFLSNIKIVEG